MKLSLKNNCIFASFNDQERHICNSKVFFYAYYSANAVNIHGYQTLYGLPCLQSSCSWSNTGNGSRSLFNKFNFIRKMTKNNEVMNSVKYSNATCTPNSATTVTLTQEFLNDFEKVKKYNEDYGLVVNNLFEVVKNQFNTLYERMEEAELTQKQKDYFYPFIWQTEDLLRVINEKVSTDTFIEIDNVIYGLKQCLNRK